MWAEIPEGFLPTWPIPKTGQLAIPHDPGKPWRIRVAAGSEGSWWQDVRPGESAALLTSASSAGLAIAVLDPEGRPAGNVHASLQESSPRAGARAWAGVRSDTGRIEAPGLPDEQELVVTIHHPLAAPLVLRGRPSALPRQVRLARAAELTGHLAAAGGAPLSGAAVEAETWTSGELPRVYRVQTATDSKGAWHLRGLPPGKVAVTFRAAGLVSFREILDLQPGYSDLGLRTFEAGTSLAVQVLDDAGSPIPGAHVVANQGLGEAEADGKGVAHLESLPAAPVQLRGTADRHLAGEAILNLPFPPDARIVLRRALTLTGRLIQSSGLAISHGTAQVVSGVCRTESHLTESGRFVLDIPPSTNGELVLRSPVTRELRVPIVPGEPGERDLGDLTAPASLSVTGRVATADGTLIPGARVWTPRQGPDGPAIAWATQDLLETRSDEDGRFHLTGLVPAAPAVLRFEAAGFARSQREVSLGQPEDEATLDVGTITLQSGSAVRVLVDPRAVAAEGAMARVDVGNRWLDPDFLTAAVIGGQALIPNVPPGKVTVSVLTGNRLLCEQAVQVSGERELDVDCQRPVLTVTGQVLSGGVPAGAGVLTWQVPSSVPARIDNVVSPAGLRQQQVAGLGRPQVDVEVGPDGRFRTEDLTPERWQVAWHGQQGAVTGAITVEIPQVERFETILPFPGLGLAGTVSDHSGAPVQGARVREMVTGALALTDASGSFAITGLKAGRAALQARREERASAIVEVQLGGADVPEPVHLVLDDANKPPSISVQVSDSGGLPASGAFVFFEEEGKGLRLVTTAMDGRALVTLEPPLPTRVRVAAFASGAWGFGGWVSWESALQGVVVQVQGSGSILVSSAQSQGSPRVVTQDGWELSWLLRQLGAPPVVSPDQPLRLGGLPEGRYSVTLDRASVTLDVTGASAANGELGH
jgi:hypothetical protein